MRVEVYYNLHKNLFSVRHKGKVIAHVYNVQLEDVTFAVQAAGNRKVREEGKKNVHAFVRGTLVEQPDLFSSDSVAVTYNPYKYTTFVNKADELERHTAASVTMHKPANGGPTILAAA
jgi:hypothetical protein|tara:strand:+ start:304 stop:657 length:354 start_codon:yes stop_codon:yes gene_type:complete